MKIKRFKKDALTTSSCTNLNIEGTSSWSLKQNSSQGSLVSFSMFQTVHHLDFATQSNDPFTQGVQS